MKENVRNRIISMLARQPQAIRNAEVILSEISAGNPAAEESSTTVHLLVSEWLRGIFERFYEEERRDIH